MGPKAVGTCRLQRKRNRAPTSLRETDRDWEFRTKLRIRMYEGSEVQETGRGVQGTNPIVAVRPFQGDVSGVAKEKRRGAQPEEEEEEERFGYSMEEDEEDESQSKKIWVSAPQPASPKSTKSEKKTGEDIADRSSLVHSVLEGLWGDAFLVARDMGLDALAIKGGLDEFVERIRKTVFPRASEDF